MSNLHSYQKKHLHERLVLKHVSSPKESYKYSDNQLCEWRKTFLRKTDRLILNEHIHTAPNWKSLLG